MCLQTFFFSLYFSFCFPFLLLFNRKLGLFSFIRQSSSSLLLKWSLHAPAFFLHKCASEWSHKWNKWIVFSIGSNYGRCRCCKTRRQVIFIESAIKYKSLLHLFGPMSFCYKMLWKRTWVVNGWWLNDYQRWKYVGRKLFKILL